MHCLLHFRPVKIFLSIIFSTRIVARNPPTQKSIFEPHRLHCSVGQRQARWCIYTVLIDVSELMVYGITHRIITFLWCFFLLEIAVLENWMVACVWYHCMAPPKCNGSNAVIIVVCYAISHLQALQFRLKTSGKCLGYYSFHYRLLQTDKVSWHVSRNNSHFSSWYDKYYVNCHVTLYVLVADVVNACHVN